MRYTVYLLDSKVDTVCVPSEDYYARGNDWWEDQIYNFTLTEIKSFSSMEEATSFLEKEELEEGDYTILPIFTKKK